MKVLTRILTVVFILYLTYTIFGQNSSPPGIGGDGNAYAQGITNNGETEPEEEDPFYYDQDYFLKKLSQKKLPVPAKKEKILWAFRLSDTNLFL